VKNSERALANQSINQFLY